MLVQPHLDTVMTRRRQRKIKSVSIKGVYQSETPCGSRKIVVSEKQTTFGNLVWELRAFNKVAWLIAPCFTSVENNGRLTHSGDSYKVTTASIYLLVGQACTRFRVLQFYGLKIGEFVLTCGATTVKQSHLSLEPGLNLYWQRFPQVTCHVTLRNRWKYLSHKSFPLWINLTYRLSSIVYRLSSIVYRLSSIVYRLCFSTCQNWRLMWQYLRFKMYDRDSKVNLKGKMMQFYNPKQHKRTDTAGGHTISANRMAPKNITTWNNIGIKAFLATPVYSIVELLFTSIGSFTHAHNVLYMLFLASCIHSLKKSQ